MHSLCALLASSHRKEKSEREESKLNTCYICGLHRRRFDGASVTFEDHTQYYHNTLSYVYFYVYLRVTTDTDLTGPEKYVKHRLQTRTIDWVPILRTWQLPQEQESNAKTKATLRSQVVTLREQLKHAEVLMKNIKDTLQQ